MEKILINSTYKILDFKNEQSNLYDLIFKFCKVNKILIFNKNVNIAFLNNTTYNLKDLDNDFSFILFSQTPKKHTLELINILYKNYSKYVFYTSYIEDKEIIISVDNNRIIYFNLLFVRNNTSIDNHNDNHNNNHNNGDQSPNINFFDMFDTIKYDKFNKSPIYILPNVITLLFVVHDLYKPENFIKLVNNNSMMTNNFILNNDLSNKYHELNTYSLLLKNIFANTKSKNDITIHKLKSIVLSEFIKIISKFDISKDIILLDTYAIDILLNVDINYNETLNIIIRNNTSSSKFNIIQYVLDILKDILKKNNIKYKKILYTRSNIFIYNDFRLKKTNIFIITEDNKKISLINLFNSTDYELIPIVKKHNNFLIPHEFVIIRFMILNLVSMQLYDKYFNKNTYSKYGDRIWSLCNSNINHSKIYYTGVYRDDKMDRFKLGSYVYRPLQINYKNTNINTNINK